MVAAPMKTRPLYFAIACFATILFGGQWVASRAAQMELPPFFIVFVRLVMIAALLCPFAKRPRGRDVWRIAAIAMLVNGINLPLTYFGVQYVDASTSAIVYQLYTPIAVVMAMFFLGERLHGMGWVGIAIALAGVALIAGGPGERPHAGGIIAIILGAAAFAGSALLTRYWQIRDVVQMHGWASLLAIPVPLGLTLALEQNQMQALLSASPAALAAVFYICVIGGLLGFFLWYWVSVRAPVSSIAPASFLNPVSGLGGGVLLLDEVLTLTRIAGAALILAGVAVVQWPRKPLPEPPAA